MPILKSDHNTELNSDKLSPENINSPVFIEARISPKTTKDSQSEYKLEWKTRKQRCAFICRIKRFVQETARFRMGREK